MSLIYRKHIGSILRKKICQRDDNKCSICGSQNKLEIHHINNWSNNNNLENLALVCKKCHRKITVLDIKFLQNKKK